MATATQLALPKAVFTNANGQPLSGGFVYTYVPGTTTNKTTWQNAAQTVANANPIQLDAYGSCLLYGAGEYTLRVTDYAGNEQPGMEGVTFDAGYALAETFAALAGSASQIFSVAFGVAGNEAIAFGQLAVPSAANSGTVAIGAAFAGNETLTFTAPCAGHVLAFGGLNLTGVGASAITGTLSIATVAVSTFAGTLSQSHSGSAAVTANETVAVEFAVTSTGVSPAVNGEYFVSFVFVPA